MDDRRKQFGPLSLSQRHTSAELEFEYKGVQMCNREHGTIGDSGCDEPRKRSGATDQQHIGPRERELDVAVHSGQDEVMYNEAMIMQTTNIGWTNTMNDLKRLTETPRIPATLLKY